MNSRPGIIGLIIFLTVCLTACSGRDPVYSEYDYAIPRIVRPVDSVLVGKYELDNFSYDRVDETNAYSTKAILLEIHGDGSFQVTNLPDMIMSSNGKPVKRQLINAMGSWSVPVDKRSAISIPIGPPNGNQRLLFVKKSESQGD